MSITFKQLLTLRSFSEMMGRVNDAANLMPVAHLSRLIKKFAPLLEQLEENTEDLRLDFCYKEGQKIVRDEKGNFQWTAEGEKGFRKAYKELLNSEVSLPSDFKPLNYYELAMALPADFLKQNPWEVMSEALSPFYEYKPDF